MALDRDLAVAFAAALGPGERQGWEMTAATGVRGLRLLRESGAFRAFALSEANPRSLEVLRANAARVVGAEVVAAEANGLPSGAPFDYVDVDPYGSPLPFLPTALQAVADGGLLGVTATDLTVLAGAQAAACRRRYGAAPVRGRLGPEGALRILLATLAREARGTGRRIEPLLSYVGGHHVRAYVRLRAVDDVPDAVATIDPAHWDGPPLAGAPPFGPMWLGAIVAPGIAERLRVPPAAARARELAVLLERLRADAGPVMAFYFEANSLAAELRLPRPPPLEALRASLIAAGFRAERTHVRPEGLRTDAPRAVVAREARRLVA